MKIQGNKVGVYMIMCIPNKKVYIGCSTGTNRRQENHLYRLRKGNHPNDLLQDDWNTYKEENFTFVIIQELQLGLSQSEYDKYEEQWMHFYQSYLQEKGYNKTLSGSRPLPNIDGINKIDRTNNDKSKAIPCICINRETGEKIHADSYYEVNLITGITVKKVYDYCSYWTEKGGRKSSKGWMVVRESDYDESFDYIGFSKIDPNKPKKTWKDYEKNRPKRVYKKKDPEEIIPYEDRNLKRCPIIAVNAETEEETIFPSMVDAGKMFVHSKIWKCINAPFKRYKHRGHYFRRAS